MRNLVLARDIPKEKVPAKTRIVKIPGLTVSIGQMLEALMKVGGEKY